MNFEEFMNIIYLLKLLYEMDRQMFEYMIKLESLKFDALGNYYDDFDSERFKEYLRVMGKFHVYSLRN